MGSGRVTVRHEEFEVSLEHLSGGVLHVVGLVALRFGTASWPQETRREQLGET